MSADRPTVTLADLQKLQEQEAKPNPLNHDEVTDYATAALMVLRGLPRGQKLRVISKMRKLLG